jgi:hypothetical protein
VLGQNKALSVIFPFRQPVFLKAPPSLCHLDRNAPGFPVEPGKQEIRRNVVERSAVSFT